MGETGAKTWPQRARSVREDWLAWMPAEKDRIFDASVADLEASYSMLSVTLDEAFALSAQGALRQARDQAAVSATLFDRLAAQLAAAQRAMAEHARHFGTLPNVAPLKPAFFRGETAQHFARKSSLLSKILFPSRSRFFHKLSVLSEIAEELAREFREAAEELTEGRSVQPGARWEALDVLHYDVNTCLRETIVMLKSFLCALPNEEVARFRQKLGPFAEPPRSSRARLARGSS